jgi:hypothetical protein
MSVAGDDTSARPRRDIGTVFKPQTVHHILNAIANHIIKTGPNPGSQFPSLIT